MANTFTNWNAPEILGPVLGVLRQNAVMPRLVTTDLQDTVARERGDTIDITKTAAGTLRDITPAETPASNQDISPTKVQLSLNRWKESSFHVTDKQASEIREGVLSPQLVEHIKVVANGVDTDILREMYAFAADSQGTAGSTPFSSTSVTLAATARRILNQQLAPLSDRYIVLDPLAEAAALTVSNILQFDQRGDQGGIIEGEIGRKLGFGWLMNQNLTTNTASTTSWVTGYAYVTAGVAAGATTITVINATQGGVINAGSLFKSAGSSQTYAVVVTTTSVTNTAVTLSISPAMATAAASADAITVVASYTPNLAFHKGACVFASRPVGGAYARDNSVQMVDPVTGVALRIMITREHYQETARVSCLWGVKMLRAEHVIRLLG